MRNSLLLILILLFGVTTANCEKKNKQFTHHNIHVKFDINQSKLEVENLIHFDESCLFGNEAGSFFLNKNLVIDSCNHTIEEINSSEENRNWKEYRIKGKIKNSQLYLCYHGVIDDQKEELNGPPKHGRTKETTGIIFDKGIYLSGSTAWIPRFRNVPLLTFKISANINAAWNIVAQGEELSNQIEGDRRELVYKSDQPTNQVYLLGNKWTKFSQMSGNVQVQAFLINADEKLANKYISATSRYLQMYEKLIGEYPYSKFALVENFWESGYGMPSFTLLGQKVIRMPWILHTSYPHELLHNYYGNGVFVDYSKGNWSEGITTYMADHLFKEIKGNGREYRKSSLTKFTDYVNDKNDFPVSKFKSRTSKASSAIGYDKVMMINHMLRIKYGEELFLQAYSDFVQSNCFKVSSFDDIRASFENVTKDNLSLFFDQWIERMGAPEITVTKVSSMPCKDGYQLSFTLNQIQKEEPFEIYFPVRIYLQAENRSKVEYLTISKRVEHFSLMFDKKPLRVEFDPEYDVMRRLDKREVAASFSTFLASRNVAFVLPASDQDFSVYKEFAESLKLNQGRRGSAVKIYIDTELSKLPNEKCIWILGKANKFAEKVGLNSEVKKLLNENERTRMDEFDQSGSLFYIQTIQDKSVGFIKSSIPEKLPELFQKLKHYGAYSLLGFNIENKNLLKSNLPVLKSPMIFNFDANFNSDDYSSEKSYLLIGK